MADIEQERLDRVADASKRIELARNDWEAAVTAARDSGISLARIATAANVSTSAIRNVEARRERMEVTAEQLQRGDRILAHRDYGQTMRHRGWTVKAPYGIHPKAGVPGIQLERRPEDSEHYELNLWPGTDFTADAVFIIERP